MKTNISILLTILTVNLLISPFLISLLNKWGLYKKKYTSDGSPVKGNNLYYKHLLTNMSTPSSFGVLFLVNLLVSLLLFENTIESSTLIISTVTLGLLGLADDIYQFIFYKPGKQWGFKARYKMAIQISILFALNYTLSNSIPYSVITSLIGSFILNSFNITDGLDGLAGGIAIPTIMFFSFLEYKSFGETPIFYITVITIIFLAVFMIFNIKPAKVFLGDSGSYAIGTLIAFLTFRYNLWFTIPAIAIFLTEGLSSFIQIGSVTFFKRKVFKIAPLHLHLLNSGWSQWKVIGSAWVLQALVTLIIFAIYINVK